MCDKTISKNKSSVLKVIAIILMVIHHIFTFPDRIKNVVYIPMLIFRNGVTIEECIGNFGSICVPIFLFLSGYGLYVVYKDNVKYKEIVNRLLKLYKNYWVIFCIFIPLGGVLGKYKFEIGELISNFLGLNYSYNPEWWFLRLYIALLILYPLIITLINKFHKYVVIVISFLLSRFNFIIIKILIILNVHHYLIDFFNVLLSYQFLFVLGIVVCKYCLFSEINNKFKINRIKSLLILITVSILIMLSINVSTIAFRAKILLTPIFIFTLSNIISENNLLIKFKKHSTNVWLIHSFFCYYLFQEISFIPKYSVLILIWILILSLGCSIIINKILGILSKVSFKFMKRNIQY